MKFVIYKGDIKTAVLYGPDEKVTKESLESVLKSYLRNALSITGRQWVILHGEGWCQTATATGPVKVTVDNTPDLFTKFRNDGEWHEDIESLVTGGMLSLCGCGNSEGTIKTLHRLLSTPVVTSDLSIDKQFDKLFYYSLVNAGLLNHDVRGRTELGDLVFSWVDDTVRFPYANK